MEEEVSKSVEVLSRGVVDEEVSSGLVDSSSEKGANKEKVTPDLSNNFSTEM